MKTKKRFLSILLSLALMLGLLPGMSMTAYADGNVAKVGETEYASLDKALSAWNDGTTLTLLANVETASTISMSSGTKTFALNGHNIKKTGNSGSVFQVTSGNLTVNGTGSISGGRGTPCDTWEIRGGGFYVSGDAAVTVNNVTITGNQAYYGGGVFLGEQATFTMNNSVISQNHINNNNGWTSGGGVWIEGSGTFIMNGGSITENTSDSQIAGVHIFQNGKFRVSGNAKVTNNKRSGSQINVSGTITVDGELTEGANIGVNHDAGVFTNSPNTDYNDASKFTSDNASYAVGKNANGQLLLGAPCTVTYNGNGATAGSAPTDSNSPYASGSTVTVLPKGNLAWDGYTFMGWKIGTGDTIYANSADNITGAEAAFTITGDTTLTAQWDAIPATAPTISTQPTDLALTYGYTSGSLSVTAEKATDTTYNDLTYQWYSNTEASNSNGTPINTTAEPAAATAAYTIPTGKDANTTEYYYCVVTATRTDNSQTATATSNVVTVTIGKAAETAPADATAALTQLTVSYPDETISAKDGYEVSSSNEGDGTAITDFSAILDNTTPTVHVRKTASDTNHDPSAWVAVTLAARPAAPTGLTTTNATNEGTRDGKISGTQAAMEYSANNGTSWTDASATETLVTPGTYLVRVKATETAPHGIAATVTVGSNYVALTEANKPVISISDNHNPPVVGDTLTAATTATDVIYEWYRDGVKISGATANTYILTADDAGKAITVKAIQTQKPDGTAYAEDARPAQTSGATAAVAKKAGPAAPADADTAGFVINYESETFTVGDAYEVSSTDGDTGLITNSSLADAFDGTGKVYIRVKETADTQAGAWLEVTLAARPAAPINLGSTNATNGGSLDGTITDVNDNMEYSADGTNWTVVTSAAQTIGNLNPGTYSVRVKATGDAPHGIAATVTVGSNYVALTEANKPVISISDNHNPPVVGDTLTAATAASDVVFEWYRDGVKISGATAGTYILTADDAGKAITVKAIQTQKPDGTAYAEDARPAQTSGATAAVAKKAGPAAPADAETAGFVINYESETFTVGDAYEASSTDDDTGLITNSSLADAFDGTGKVYIRVKETADTQAGAWLEVTLAARPAAPAGLTTTGATDGSAEDGKIIGVTTAMEYSADGSKWTAVTSTTIEGLKSGTYTVRLKATDSAPHGLETGVKVGSRELVLSDGQKPTAGNDLAYTGSELNLVNVPAETLPEGTVEMQYAIGTDATTVPTAGWSTSIPAATKAGIYYVWYCAKGDGNHNDTVPEHVLVKVAQAEITITAASGEWTYDGKAHTSTGVTVTAGKLMTGDTLSATAGGRVTNVADTKQGNNPVAEGWKILHGETDVTANYAVTPVAGTLAVTKAEATVTAENKTKAYDNDASTDPALTAVVTGAVGEDKINYTLSRTAGQDAKEYAITVTVGENPNYEVKGTNGVFTITKAKAAVAEAPEPMLGMLENDEPMTLVTAGKASGGTMQYALGTDDKTTPEKEWSEKVPAGTKAGTYYVWYKAQGDGNHTDSAAACVIAKIAKLPEPGPGPEPGPESEPTNKILLFVRYCYNMILGREADEAGENYWFGLLSEEKISTTEAVSGFIFSGEFAGKSLNTRQQMAVVGETMETNETDMSTWSAALEQGSTLAEAINGLGASNEFDDLRSRFDFDSDYASSEDLRTDLIQLRAFVARCYDAFLGREADDAGMNAWAEPFASGKKTAAEIIAGFVFSEEFEGRYLSTEEIVKALYRVMLNRTPDEAGMEQWVKALDNGDPIQTVINGIAQSDEFIQICKACGIRPGFLPVGPEPEPEDQWDEQKITAFIRRAYKEGLDRDAGEEEAAHWVSQVMSKEISPAKAARMILTSEEMEGRALGNEAFVKVMYKVFVNRDADPDGLAYWRAKLEGEEALTRVALMREFCNSKEYKDYQDTLKK